MAGRQQRAARLRRSALHELRPCALCALYASRCRCGRRAAWASSCRTSCSCARRPTAPWPPASRATPKTSQVRAVPVAHASARVLKSACLGMQNVLHAVIVTIRCLRPPTAMPIAATIIAALIFRDFVPTRSSVTGMLLSFLGAGLFSVAKVKEAQASSQVRCCWMRAALEPAMPASVDSRWRARHAPPCCNVDVVT